MSEILVLGHLCIDLMPSELGPVAFAAGGLRTAGPLHMRLGGAVAGTGRALADLGLPVRAAAAVGGDSLGVIVRDMVHAMFPAGADIDTLPAATSYSVVLQPAGQDRMFLHHAGVNDLYTGAGARLPARGIVHVGYPPLMRALVADGAQPLRDLFARARALGTVTSLDMAVVDPTSDAARVPWREVLGRLGGLTDVFSPSFDDLTSAFGEPAGFSETRVERMADDLMEAGYGIVAIMCGEHGVYLATADAARLAGAGTLVARLAGPWAARREWIAAEPVKAVVSTTGAGDTASAGLLAGIAAGLEPRECLRFAVQAAAARIEGRALPAVQ
ncbi:MAG: PfkB family carbohydrate kinase [Bifidobacteriaceae bacterium]|jgi:sugar/nucleoside kinase (ribokinase family)|nr:PfkB family carbohydrate kinase [Bifidobacteriaceae bacterium]